VLRDDFLENTTEADWDNQSDDEQASNLDSEDSD
jgi:hypothetical protein